MSTLQSLQRYCGLLKWFLVLVVALNARSLPGIWHYRVFAPLFKLRLKYFLLRARTLLKSRKEKVMAEENWLTSITPVGSHPFERTVRYKTYASIDDCDFNMHLSNSSYPKTLDCARFKAAIMYFPQFLRVGGIIPLAGTHFHFIREIPMFAPFELRLTMGGWDDKWAYVIGRFVTKPSGKLRSVKPKQSETEKNDGQDLFHPGAIGTPVDASATGSPSKDGDTTDLNALAARLATAEEPDGAILHTISVSHICFKIGRITVPPALVVATNGMCAPSNSTEAYTPTNPPPHWQKVVSLTYNTAGGSAKQLREFYKGAWRDIPAEERWWVDALGGDVERERKLRLEAVEGVRKGMEGARITC